MDEDLALGDLGMTDALSMTIDVPDPSLANPDGVSTDLLGPGGIAATIADLGLSPSAPSLSVEDGMSSPFDGSSAAVALPGDSLGSLPAIMDAPAPEVPVAGAEPGFSEPSPVPTSTTGVSASAEMPLVDEGIAAGLGELPYLDTPPAPAAPFAGVAAPPEELLDLQMAAIPPEPSQEGFPTVSDAPFSAPAPGSLAVSGPAAAPLSLAMAKSISNEVWDAPAASASTAAPTGKSGHSVHIENLHLPAADANEFFDGLLGTCPDATNADLKGWV